MAVTTIPPEQLIAHRGHQAVFPENSTLAILDAIAAGAKKIEFDVQCTQDGYLALYHDDDMLRISGAEKHITGLKKSDLAQYFVVEPKRLGTRFIKNPIEFLDDLIPLIQKHPHVQFFMELKEESIAVFGAHDCFKYLKKSLPVIPENLVFISFNLPAVKRAKQEGFLKTALVFRDWDNRNLLLDEAAADYGFVNYTRIPRQEAIVADKPIMVYEVKFPLIAEQLLARGASAVESFNIRALLNNL